jgi:hypothetical protein
MKTLLTALALTLAGHGALAHDDATLDKVQAPNGGQLRMAGAYHFELVVAKDIKSAKENPLAVYLSNHAGQKIPSAGSNGVATILSGGQKTSVKLSPAGDNKLAGNASYASTPDMKVVVSVSFGDKQTEQARFTPLSTHSHQH